MSPFCSPQEIMEGPPDIMCLLMEEINTTIVLPRKLNLNLIKPLELTTNLQAIGRTEEHIFGNTDATGKIQPV